MPELAEVEFYRKQWDAGRKQKIVSVHLNAGRRIFRGVNTRALRQTLTGATLLRSEAHGKQMLFRFSKSAGNTPPPPPCNLPIPSPHAVGRGLGRGVHSIQQEQGQDAPEIIWLGLHLGMTGKLASVKADAAPFVPAKHDHLVLRQARRNLVFNDPRQFGRIRFHAGRAAPPWWTDLPPALLGKEFTVSWIETFLARHRTAPIKAVLLMQDGFPGIGNWMADEILWQAGIHPSRPAGSLLLPNHNLALNHNLNQSFPLVKTLHRVIKSVSRTAMKTVGVDYGDLPQNWLFDRRWKRGGHCPKDAAPLRHATIAGRTTCWCPVCQKGVDS